MENVFFVNWVNFHLHVKREFSTVTNCVHACVCAHRHVPELSLFVERVSYGHLDHFQLVAWRLALDSVLRRYSRKQTVFHLCAMCVRHIMIVKTDSISQSDGEQAINKSVSEARSQLLCFWFSK